MRFGTYEQAEQDAELDPSCLPTLSPDTDIDPNIVPSLYTAVPISVADGGGARANMLLRRQAFDSNGVVYANLRLESRHVSPHLRPYLPLLSNVLGSVGAGELDYRQQSLAVERCCGGVSVSLSRTPPFFGDATQIHEGLLLQTYGLAGPGHFERGLELLRDIVCAPRLDDVPRLRTLIGSIAQRKSGSLTRRGHSIALSDACAPINAFNAGSNENAGLPQVCEFACTCACACACVV